MIVPGYGLHKELELLVRGGFTPAEVLKLATVNPSKFLGRMDIGIISAGTQADLVILAADPLEDIRNTSLIDGVILQGKYLDRGKLDELLIGAKAAAKKH
jgi:imidazolonepropionase-like amidohydrolase